MRIMLLAAASDIHCVRWANQLSVHGHEVHVCSVANHKPSIDGFSNNVTLHDLAVPAPFGYYLNVPQLRNIISRVQPDILNAHYASGYGTLGRLVGFRPYLLSVYGSDVYDFPYKSRFNMMLIRKNLMAASAIASTSYAMAVQTSSLVDIPASDIHITPFGVDTSRFYRRRVKNNSHHIVLGSIKKLTPKYGLRYGILAVDHLLRNLIDERQNLSIEYRIYGEGDEKEELARLVKERGLEDVVKFMGRIPNDSVPQALNEIDIFLGTSILDSESFGVAVVEAMACETPVIVTDVDGFNEVVDSGNAGIVVPRKDPVAMAQQIYRLVRDPNLRSELGMKQRKRVLENYDWVQNVRKMERIYEMLTRDNTKDVR